MSDKPKKRVYFDSFDEEIPLLPEYKDILVKKHTKTHEKNLMLKDGLAEADKTHLKTFHIILEYPMFTRGLNRKMMRIIIFSIFENEFDNAQKEHLIQTLYNKHLEEINRKSRLN